MRSPAMPTARAPRARRSASIAAGVASAAIAAAVAGAPPAWAAPATIDLATSDSYSVLASQAVSNTGPTVLSGDLGLSPNTASSITGFPPGLVGGITHAGDAPALQARADLTTAYGDAAGRASTQSVAGDLVGTTKAAGVYRSTGPLALSGTLTLDGAHNPDSVFIFQVAETLTTATASSITLVNGAQACHVFWQVGSSATLGSASVFRGTIMAQTSVTVGANVLVQGRALARDGAVTFDSDTFTVPQCTGVTAGQTSTTQSLPVSPVTVGGTIAVGVAVTGTGTAVPTGTVTVYDGGVAVASAPVDSTGHATVDVAAGPTPGTRTLTSHYGGSRTELPSNSTPGTVMVIARAPTPAPSSTGALPGSTAPAHVTVTSPAATAGRAASRSVAASAGVASSGGASSGGAGNGGLAVTGAPLERRLTVLAGALLAVGAGCLLIARRPRAGRHHR